VSLVREGARSHIFARLWYPLTDETIVYENSFFCGRRPQERQQHIVSREEFNLSACRTCVRKYALAHIIKGRGRQTFPRTLRSGPDIGLDYDGRR